MSKKIIGAVITAFLLGTAESQIIPIDENI
jgi:hypothetical protein